MPQRFQPGAASAHQGTFPPLSDRRDKQCPCGCGQNLRLYKGKRALVCYDVWRVVPVSIRMIYFDSRLPLPSRRAAARTVLRMAIEVRDQRYQQQPLKFAGADPVESTVEPCTRSRGRVAESENVGAGETFGGRA